jgi:hypothetical protein
MSSKFSLARAAAVALVAIGSVASLGTDAFAVNRTWTPVGSGTASASWGTALVYASNWSGGTAAGNPTANDLGIFNATSTRTIKGVAGNTVPIGVMQLSGAQQTFSTPTTTILISGTGAVPNVGITSSATGNQIFQTGVQLSAARTTFQNTGSGELRFTGTLDLAGKYLKGEGTINTTNLESSVAGATYEAVSGTQSLFFDPTLGGNVSTLLVNGATVSGDGSATTDLSVTSGKYLGNGTFQNATITSGVVDLDNNAVLSTTSFTQSAGGTTLMNVNSDLSSSSVFGNYELGGSFSLNGSSLGSSTYAQGTTWGLFLGTNFTGGSASPLNDASNFSSFAMTPASSGSPYYGTFTKYGQEWIGPKASDGTFLVFQAASGNLVVVPEPSTMVFAGLGVAMSGWTMWKKRRLGKLLAAKAG